MVRFRLLPFLAVLLIPLAAGCSFMQKTVRIGYVNPITGALAGNGEGYDWVIDQMYDYARQHPITMHGRDVNLEIIVYDSESDRTVCKKMAEQLVLYDKVDMLIATQTPETVIPIAEVAEQYGVPCVSMQAPVDPVAQAREKYNWTFHAFWTLDTVYECYRALWTLAGFPAQSGAKVGLLFANDVDGTSWHDVFVRRLSEDGYAIVDPGQYPLNNSSFDSIAKLFKEESVSVLTGTNLPPDFMNAMKALAHYSVPLDCITMGKCGLMYTDASALGEAAVGLMTEVWWDENENFISDLTGFTASDVSARYARDNFDLKMPQPTAYAYAAFELALHALRRADSTDRRKLRTALSRLDVQTIVGPIVYNHVMNGLVYAQTPVGGGQWQLENGVLMLKVIDNSLCPAVKLTGAYKAENVSDRVKEPLSKSGV